MASIKISQLPSGGSIDSTDEFPVSRGGLETYKLLANQIVTAGSNAGLGAEIYQTSDTSTGSTTLKFRSLSGVGEGIQVIQDANTVNITISGQNPSKNTFTGDGTQTTFTLSNASSRNVNNYRVDIDGVLQEPGSSADYYLNGSNLIFTSAPPSGSKVVVVSNNLLPLVEAVPAVNSITPSQFASSVGTNEWRLVTTNFTMNAGDRIAVNTTSSPITGTLPASPLSGTIITLGDAGNYWSTNNLTVIGGTILGDTSLICDSSSKLVILFYTGTSWSVFA